MFFGSNKYKTVVSREKKEKDNHNVFFVEARNVSLRES